KPSQKLSVIAEALEPLPDNFRLETGKKILNRVSTNLKSLPEPMKVPQPIDLNAPIHNYKELRRVSRYWYFLGCSLAADHKYNESMACFTAITMLSYIMETGDNETSMTLINHMIGVALRKLAASGIIQTARHMKLSLEDTRRWISRLKKLENKIPDLTRVIKYEKQLIPSLYNPEDPNLNRSTFRALSSDKELHKKYLNPYYNPLIEALEGDSYSKTREVFNKTNTSIAHLQEQIFSATSIKYFFSPEDLLIQLFLVVCYPNFSKALEQDRLSQSALRGAIVVFALQSYKQAWKVLPKDLKELENWIKIKMPNDVFTQKPFNYSPESRKVLFSPGPDLKENTDDDIVFIPLKTK
ncbi:MAG: hypothetical protein ACQETH_17120, partial [Candidatus Rifleibacteriota bacterium]